MLIQSCSFYSFVVSLSLSAGFQTFAPLYQTLTAITLSTWPRLVQSHKPVVLMNFYVFEKL